MKKKWQQVFSKKVKCGSSNFSFTLPTLKLMLNRKWIIPIFIYFELSQILLKHPLIYPTDALLKGPLQTNLCKSHLKHTRGSSPFKRILKHVLFVLCEGSFSNLYSCKKNDFLTYLKLTSSFHLMQF